jgi:GT2 family glycosyltransferase
VTGSPRATVAISTYRRAGLLPGLVAALEAQTLPADQFEVVIVDNGSRDETAERLDELKRRTSLDLRVVVVPRNRGAAAGRNVAWRAGRGRVVAFTDDDCEPTPGWLRSGLKAIDAGAHVVAGRTVPHPEQVERLRHPFARTVVAMDARYFNTSNVFYRRDDLEAVGGFDEEFSLGGEDTDLAWRVRDAGAQVLFENDALVYHHVWPSSFAAVLGNTWRWSDIPRFFRKHPEARRELLSSPYFWKPTHPRVLAAAVGLAVAWRRPAGLLLALPWLDFRLRIDPPCPGPRRRWLALPGTFVIDLLEVIVMLRGSKRHGTILL